MKIIFCLHHFLPEYIGGTEIYTLNLSKQLMQHNVEVMVLAPNFDKTETEQYFYESIKVIKYAENSIEDRQMILGKKKSEGLSVFAEILQYEKPNIVHFHELAPGKGINIFHVEKVQQLKIAIVISFHVPFYSCFRGSLLYKDQTKCDGEIIVKRCTECIYHQKDISGAKAFLLGNAANFLFDLNINATSLNNHFGTALGFPFVIDKLKKDLLALSHYAEKIIVIAGWYKEVLEKNKVPSKKLTFIKQGLPKNKAELKLPVAISKPLRVVFLGRITSLKGLHLLIEVILQLSEENITLDIFGSEADINYVSFLKNKTKGINNINWKGMIHSEEVISTLSNYHLLCLPSAFEMSPLVIQEAFAAGLPVLASDVYGNAEQITDGINGWLFRFNDVADLKSKLAALINDTTLIEKTGTRAPGLNTFKEVGEQHMELYDSVIQNYNGF